jgi:hypothetical protein
MNLPDPLLVTHALASVSLVGLIWTIQLVHYPLFLRVPPEAFAGYETEHMRRITWLVGPLMLLEAGSTILVTLRYPESALVWIGAALLILIWVLTATVQGPLHTRLARDGFDEARIRLLVRSNWARTIAWSIRGMIALLILGAEDAFLVTP